LNLKKILKKIKLAESSISTLFGFIVVLIVGVLIFKYFQGAGKTNLPVVNNDIADEEEQLLANLAEGEKSTKFRKANHSGQLRKNITVLDITGLILLR